MLSFTGSLRVFVALEPCDMRKGFDGLSGMVASKLNEDLQSGALFVFSNRSHTRLKINLLGWPLQRPLIRPSAPPMPRKPTSTSRAARQLHRSRPRDRNLLLRSINAQA